jgi:hypothetical protein
MLESFEDLQKVILVLDMPPIGWIIGLLNELNV